MVFLCCCFSGCHRPTTCPLRHKLRMTCGRRSLARVSIVCPLFAAHPASCLRSSLLTKLLYHKGRTFRGLSPSKSASPRRVTGLPPSPTACCSCTHEGLSTTTSSECGVLDHVHTVPDRAVSVSFVTLQTRQHSPHGCKHTCSCRLWLRTAVRPHEARCIRQQVKLWHARGKRRHWPRWAGRC